jgi:hypothetical protein
MVYIAFVFALALACLASMEFIYLMFIESANRELKRRVRFLERQNLKLVSELKEKPLWESREHSAEHTGEAWPEYIEDPRH